MYKPKRWYKHNNDVLKDIKNAVKKIKHNCGVEPVDAYITGVINYPDVVNILKECNCEYDERQYTYGILIDNVIDKGNHLDKYSYLQIILKLHKSILFIDKLTQKTFKAP